MVKFGVGGQIPIWKPQWPPLRGSPANEAVVAISIPASAQRVIEVVKAMDLNLQKEQFSNAYVRAVAAAAGFQVYKPEPDIDKIDWVIAAPGPRKTVRSPKVEIQLKCTSREILRAHHLAFFVDSETYDNLRDPNHMVPRILLVVVVPNEVNDWLVHAEENLALHHCGYWFSLRDLPPSDNETGETIHIPRAQQFTVDALTGMMERLGVGGSP